MVMWVNKEESKKLTVEKVKEILNNKGFKFNGKEFELVKGNKVVNVGIKDNNVSVYVFNSDKNKIVSREYTVE